MLLRHEVLIDDIMLDGDPGFSMSVRIPESGDLVECIVISNYDQYVDEDLPSLLIRQDIEVQFDPTAVLDLNSYQFNRLPRDYSSLENPRPAARSVPRRIWARTDRQFRAKYPHWDGFMQDIDSRLSNQALKVLNTIRWRCGHYGSRNVLRDRSLLVEIPLKPVPEWAIVRGSLFDTILRFAGADAMVINSEMQETIQGMIIAGDQEPLPRDLLREAEENQESSPRSSLIVAVAAAEVGVKGFLTQHLPSWSQSMILEMPQPPIQKLMSKTLPELLKSQRKYSSPELPKESVRKIIIDAAEKRNIAVHQPPDSPAARELDKYLKDRRHYEVITAISDLLGFLDYFSGKTWALENLSRKSMEDWNSRNS